MEILFLIGRILYGGYFVMNGVNHFKKRQIMVEYAKSKGVSNPDLVVKGSGLLILLGGLGIMTGAFVEWAVLFLVLFLIFVSFKMHNFWVVQDLNMKMVEMINFTKNIALLGAALAMLGTPTPWPYSL